MQSFRFTGILAAVGFCLAVCAAKPYDVSTYFSLITDTLYPHQYYTFVYLYRRIYLENGHMEFWMTRLIRMSDINIFIIYFIAVIFVESQVIFLTYKFILDIFAYFD